MPTVGTKVKPKNTTKFVTGRGGSRRGEKGDYFTHTPPPPPLSLSLLAVICSRFFVVEVIFSFDYFFFKDDQTSNVSKKHR